MNNIKTRLEILQRAMARIGPVQLRAVLKTGEVVIADGSRAINLLYEGQLAKVEAMDSEMMCLADLVNGLLLEGVM